MASFCGKVMFKLSWCGKTRIFEFILIDDDVVVVNWIGNRITEK